MGYQDLSSPVIRLRRLSDNELLALVKRLGKLYMQREGLSTLPITDAETELFITRALSRAGADELVTPREIIRDFLTLLNIMKDNPGATFNELVMNSHGQRVGSDSGDSEDLFENVVQPDAAAQPNKKVSLFDIEI